jgi:hypothetical protein
MLCAQGQLGKTPTFEAREIESRVAVAFVWRSALTARAASSSWRLSNRRTLEIGLIAICCLATSPGCTVCRLGYRTVIREPAKYATNADRLRSLKTYRQWAQQEWHVVSAECPDINGPGGDYAGGFVSGFVDYVRLGGNGEPPPVPPREYWNISTRAGSGKDRAAQWFDGYRHGARVAMDGGYRELATLQSSLVTDVFDGPFSGPAVDGGMHPAGPDILRQSEDLPFPEAADSPFEDDSLPTQPPSTTEEPASNRDDSPPAAERDNANPMTEPTIPQSFIPDTGNPNTADQLTIEDIAIQARANSWHALTDPKTAGPVESASLAANTAPRTTQSGPGRAAAISTTDSATLRIVRAEQSAETGGWIAQPDAEE